MVKTLASPGSVDYWRMMNELRIISEVANQRGYTAKEYLLVIMEYVEKVTEGIHKNMAFDEDGLALVLE